MNKLERDFSVNKFINDLFEDLTLTLPALGCHFEGKPLVKEQIVQGNPISLKNKLFLLFSDIARNYSRMTMSMTMVLSNDIVQWCFILQQGIGSCRFEDCPSWDKAMFCSSLPDQEQGFSLKLPQGKPFSESPALDWNKLAKAYGGALSKSMARTFLKRAETLLAYLSQAFEEKDVNEVFRLSHSLKGAARGVFALPLSSYASQLEELARGGSLNIPLFHHLRDSYRQLKAFFSQTMP